MKILIVDDEPAIARLYSTVLNRAGFANVKAVSSGMEALDIIGTQHSTVITRRDNAPRPNVDLLLTDIMLPDISGYEVCKRFKKSTHEFTPVILLTGLNIEDTNARYIESGADDFLTKPARPNELVARVTQLLRRKADLLLEESRDNMRLAEAAKAAKHKQPAELAKASENMPDAGQRIGDWTIARTISWGGASVVFEVHDGDGRVGAMKMLTSQARMYPDVIARFQREGELMASLEHPHIIRVYDVAENQAAPYYVMELIDGPNVEKLVAQRGVLDFDLAYRIARDIADALACVHDHDVIHRDLKLNNIYVKADGSVKLGDFGIALAIGDLRITQHGYAIGTPLYMAPEQFDGRAVTVQSDIYSFGVLVYHMITGHLPFTAVNAMELMRKHLIAEPDPLSKYRPGIDPAWEKLIVSACLAKRPEDRPDSMHLVHDAILTLADHPF